MPITRTPIIDDDGSGTTGTVLDNAWKQELYGQIDGLAAGTGVVQTYTPIWSATGAQPVLGNGTLTGEYTVIGELVWARIILTFGSTTTAGTGGWLFTIPLNARGTVQTIGNCLINAGAYTVAGAYMSAANKINPFAGAVGSPAASMDATHPTPWTGVPSSWLELFCTYRKA